LFVRVCNNKAPSPPGCFSLVETLYLVRFQWSARCSSLDSSMYSRRVLDCIDLPTQRKDVESPEQSKYSVPSPRGGFGGLIPPKESSKTPPNWNV